MARKRKKNGGGVAAGSSAGLVSGIVIKTGNFITKQAVWQILGFGLGIRSGRRGYRLVRNECAELSVLG